MKKFLTQLALFLGLLFGLMGTMYLVNLWLIHQNPYQLPANVRRLVIGDSQPRCDVDPTKIDSCVNVSQAGEMMLMTYFKAKALVEANPQLTTLIVGLAHHSISDFNDFKLYDIKWSGEMIDRMYAIAPYRELNRLPIDHELYAMTLIKRMMLFPKKSHYAYIGDFNTTKESTLGKANVKEALDRHFKPQGRDATLSPTVLAFLDSLTTLTQRHDLRLVLVGLPVHATYHVGIPSRFRVSYDSLHALLDERPGVAVLDLTQFPLADSLFRDYDHLNALGAAVVTKAMDVQLDSLFGKGW